jgi:hypothetical protein
MADRKFAFKPAVRDRVSLLIQMAGGTGSGKTYSAMRLAAGIAGDKPFAVIDTEAERAKHYADFFRFDHLDFRPPFSPDDYLAAIKAADDAGYPAIVIDSMSHEWAGDGGVLDWHDRELDRMAGNDWKKRDACSFAAWSKPKAAHKKMMSRLLQCRNHLIFCLRAEEKVEMIKDENGKTKFVPKASRTGLDGWIPICEKNFPFEMTASFLLTDAKPGIPQPIKLQQQHRSIFPEGQVIDEETGRRLAAWASGADRLSEEEIAAQIAAVEPMIAGLASADAVRQWWAGHQKTLDEQVKPAILKLCTERANALKTPAAETQDAA